MKRSREPEEDTVHLGRDDPLDGHAGYHSDSNVAIRPVTKITELDEEAVLDQDDHIAMKCTMPPHKEPVSFKTYDDYEAHYSSFHTNRCLECHRNFPSEHLLGVHIEESHDPLVVVKRDRGEHTYSCFVEGCERKCMTPQKRRMHLIDKHMYPKNYFFAITRDGIDGRRSLLNEGGHGRRRSSTGTQTQDARSRASLQGNRDSSGKAGPSTPASPNQSQHSKGTLNEHGARADTDMTDLAGAMSALTFVPSSVRFGRGRAGFAKK